jgi:2,4-dienoyl-CoA reductase (NADPH2)
VLDEAPRQVFLLQRKASRVGAGLNKTSGWVHRATLARRGVEMIPGVNYEAIDADGVHVSFGEKRENGRTIEVDDVVVCAGQEPRRDLLAQLRAARLAVHLVGGADVAAELDAKRAIDQGTRLALAL